MEPILNIKDLRIGFPKDGDIVQAVDGVDLQIFPGETVGLVGESGCGKSVTSLSTIKLLPKSTIISGEVNFKQDNILTKSEKELKKIRGNGISMIFQDPMTSLNPVLTIEKQIEEVIYYHKGGTKKEIRQRIIELLEMVKIPDGKRRMKEYPHQMSGGIRQRIMIAIALASDPDLLIADEPTTALDVSVQAQILALINDLQVETNTAVLMISHDLGVISQVADRVNIMYAGQIVEKAKTEDIFAEPQHPYTKGLLKAIPRLDEARDELEEIPGMVPELTKEFTGCRFYDRCSVSVDACKLQDIPMYESKNSIVRCIHYQDQAEKEMKT